LKFVHTFSLILFNWLWNRKRYCYG